MSGLTEEELKEKLKILPQGLLEKCINQRVLVIMKSKKEFLGTLTGYDEFYRIFFYLLTLDMVLTDVYEMTTPESEGEKREKKFLKSLMLNGNNIVMIVPGAEE